MFVLQLANSAVIGKVVAHVFGRVIVAGNNVYASIVIIDEERLDNRLELFRVLHVLEHAIGGMKRLAIVVQVSNDNQIDESHSRTSFCYRPVKRAALRVNRLSPTG